MQQAPAAAAVASMSSEAPQEGKRDDDRREEEKQQGKPKPEADAEAGGASATQATTAPAAAVHEPPAPKRIIRTPAPPAPKRATRASTGAPIALTAKGSLYKANKDTGGRRESRGNGCRRARERSVEGSKTQKHDERIEVLPAPRLPSYKSS